MRDRSLYKLRPFFFVAVGSASLAEKVARGEKELEGEGSLFSSEQQIQIISPDYEEYSKKGITKVQIGRIGNRETYYIPAPIEVVKAMLVEHGYDVFDVESLREKTQQMTEAAKNKPRLTR